MSVHRLGPLVALNANLAAVRHLTPVPDPKPPPRLAERGAAQPSIAELERWATVLRVDCVRMLAVAKSGHLDSSLSAATQAVIAAEVGHLDLALDYVAEAAFVDLHDLAGNTRDGLHMASLAGVWMAMPKPRTTILTICPRVVLA